MARNPDHGLPIDLRPCAINVVRLVQGRFVTMDGRDIAVVLEAARLEAARLERLGDGEDEENPFAWW